MKRLFVSPAILFASMAYATEVNHLIPPPSPPPVTTMLDYSNVWKDGAIVDFALTFDQPPDFFTIDAFDRPATSFQFYLGSMKNPSYVIRGDDIHHGPIEACTVQPFGAGCSGGWGIPVGIANVTLDGSSVSFSFERDLFPIMTGDFTYDLITFEYGRAGYTYSGRLDGGPSAQMNPSLIPIWTPEPDALILIGIGMIAVAGRKWAA